ncbi:MAG: methylation-associated defense system protein MAD4 [Desulfotomaculales bacterium]
MIKDLVVLVADKNMEYTIKGLLSRPQALGIRQPSFDCFVHPEHDPGCLLRGHDFLRSLVNTYTHALVMLDHDGCGRKHQSRKLLEKQIEENLMRSGWGDRAAAIVISPELETWVWNNSPHVDRIIGWAGKGMDLRSWLIQEGFTESRKGKPKQPKEAFEQALKLSGKARSSSLFFQLARSVSVEGCANQAFLKLKATLQKWFPIE